MNVRIKGEDGVNVRGKEELKEVWKSHFERLMNEKTKRETMGLKKVESM